MELLNQNTLIEQSTALIEFYMPSMYAEIHLDLCTPILTLCQASCHTNHFKLKFYGCLYVLNPIKHIQ